jgi:hypothetical protein
MFVESKHHLLIPPFQKTLHTLLGFHVTFSGTLEVGYIAVAMRKVEALVGHVPRGRLLGTKRS